MKRDVQHDLLYGEGTRAQFDPGRASMFWLRCLYSGMPDRCLDFRTTNYNN